jgi:hypothetical protein
MALRRIPRAVRLCLQRAGPSMPASDPLLHRGCWDAASAASTKGDGATEHASAENQLSAGAASDQATAPSTVATLQSLSQARRQSCLHLRVVRPLL